MKKPDTKGCTLHDAACVKYTEQADPQGQTDWWRPGAEGWVGRGMGSDHLMAAGLWVMKMFGN